MEAKHESSPTRERPLSRTAVIQLRTPSPFAIDPKSSFGIAGPNVRRRIETEHWNAKIGRSVQGHFPTLATTRCCSRALAPDGNIGRRA